MRNNTLEVKVTLTLNQLKMVQVGADLMTVNFNRTHPKHGYVQHDKIFGIDDFIDWAIREKYESVVKENKLLTSEDFS